MISIIRILFEQLNLSFDKFIKNIKNPEDLLNKMDFIKYGWVDRNFKKYYNFDEWYEKSIIIKPFDVYKHQIGTCYEQVIFEVYVFQKRFPNHDIKIFHIQTINHSSHMILIFKEPKQKLWSYFEHSFNRFKGIYNNLTIQQIIKQNKKQITYDLKSKKNLKIQITEIPKKKLQNFSNISGKNFCKLINYQFK